MEKIIQKPFENMKKISLDVNEEILQIIDELVRLTKTSRTAIIGSLVGEGMSPFFRYLESSWKEQFNKKNLDEKKKKKVGKVLKSLKKIERTMWDSDYYKS